MQEQTVIMCTRKKKNLNSISRVVSNHFIHKLNQLLLCHEKGFLTNLISVVGMLKLYQKEKYSESPACHLGSKQYILPQVTHYKTILQSQVPFLLINIDI